MYHRRFGRFAAATLCEVPSPDPSCLALMYSCSDAFHSSCFHRERGFTADYDRELAEFEREQDLGVIEEAHLVPMPSSARGVPTGMGSPLGPEFTSRTYLCASSSAGEELEWQCSPLCPKLLYRRTGAMRWEVSDWNENAIALYKPLGAEFRHQWKSVVLTGDALRRLAEKTQ